MPKNIIHVLLIEDNPGDARLIHEYLRLSGFDEFEFTHALSLKTGLERLLQQQVDVILLDLGLPDAQGMDTFVSVNSQVHGIPIIVLTGLDDSGLSLAALKLGAQDYLPKNEINSELLIRAIRYAIERKAGETKLAERNGEIELLYESSLRLSRTLDLTELYQTLYNLVLSIMDCDSLFVSSYDPSTGLIRCTFGVASGGIMDVSAYPPILLEPEGRGTQSQVIHTAKALLLNDYITHMQTSKVQLYVKPDGKTLEASELEKDEDRPRSALILPIILESKVVGIIQIFSIKRNAYSVNDLKITEALAAQIAVASANALLYQNAQNEIAERRQAEDALRESEEKWRMLVSNTPDFIALLDSDYKFLFMNRYAEGFKAEKVIGTSVFKYLFPESVQLFKDKYKECLESWQPVQFEYFAMGDRGEMRYYHNGLIPLHNKNNAINVLSVARDITDRKQAEDELRASEVRFRNLIENAPGAITLLGSDGRLRFVSSSTQRILGYLPDDMMGVNPIHYTHPDDLPALLEVLNTLITNPGQVATIQYRVKHKNGSWLWIESTISNLLNEPTIQAIAFNFQDISERKRAEQELLNAQSELEQRVVARTADLKVANIALEKAARLKDEFLASMSHELRTPLTGILGLSESLQLRTYGDLTEKQNNVMKMIESSGRHLLELINDILDLSKIEAGKLDMQFEMCSISGICQASLQIIKGMAAQKKQDVGFSITPDSIILRADGRRLKQMLVNLLSNAVKFTPEGGNLGVKVVGSELEKRVRITVWDKGIGIKSEDFPRLFKPFIQLDSSLARQYAGTGLGLSLVRRMADLQGGSVEFESKFGEGSCFTIVLPWDNAEPKPAYPNLHANNTPAVSSSQYSPLVIVVDDNEVILASYSAYLAGQNCRVLPVYSGYELLQKAPEIHPDIILMDIQMPGMDGLEATRLIRSHADPQFASTPIIAITALAMPGDRDQCIAAGVSHYLSKPIHLPDLLARIHELTRI